MSRARKPLYPRAWGSGTTPFEATYKVFSVEAGGRGDLEAGDKIILPEEAFKEVSRLRLEFPLMMLVKSAKKGAQETKGYNQFSGVLEFSAPKGVAWVPTWMIKKLGIREGGRLAFKSVTKVPKGEFARFRPHSDAFLDFVSALGVRNVMELAMQHYSALSTGQTILIRYGNDTFKVDVVETKPGKSISLYGSVDLKVEFAPIGEEWVPEKEPENTTPPKVGSRRPVAPREQSTLQGRRPVRKSSKGEPHSREKEAAKKEVNGRLSKRMPGNAINKTPTKQSSTQSSVGLTATVRNAGNLEKQLKRNMPEKMEMKKEFIRKTDEEDDRAIRAIRCSESGTVLDRKDKLAKFKTRNLQGLEKVSTATGNNLKGESTMTTGGGQLGNTIDDARAAPAGIGAVKVGAEPASDVLENPKPKTVAFTGTGNVLGTGAVAPPPPCHVGKAPATSQSTTIGGSKADLPANGDAFAGNGKPLGGGLTGASVPWADLHRERHARHMDAKKRQEEQAKQAEKAAKRAEAEKNERLIAQLEKESKERDLIEAEKKALLGAKRQELESKVEEKLLRDALIKEQKAQRAAAREKKKQGEGDQKIAECLAMENERRMTKSPVAVGSAISAARKSKRAASKGN
jgi:hypothetical protein